MLKTGPDVSGCCHTHPGRLHGYHLTSDHPCNGNFSMLLLDLQWLHSDCPIIVISIAHSFMQTSSLFLLRAVNPEVKSKFVFFFYFLFFSLSPSVMNDGCLGSGCFPSQLRGRKTEMEGGEKRGGGGGQTGGIWFLWEKIRFLCTWPSVTMINIAS